MSMFQIILLVFLGILCLVVLVSGVRRSIGRPTAAVFLGILTIGILATIEPDRTTVIARAMGIARGTDLILYIMTIVVLQGFFIFYLRLRKVRRELTLLVRQLAIMEAPGSNSWPPAQAKERRTPAEVPPEKP